MQRAAAAIVLFGALASAGLASARVVGGPTARTPADRLGDAATAGPTVAVPGPCSRVVVLGDSLVDNARPWLVAGLTAAGYVHLVDAHPSRETGTRRAAPYSGVLAARSARTTFGEADCWVVALGSNDLLWGGGDPATAARLVDELLIELTPGARVWWMNVDYHRDPRYDIDFAGRTSGFNAVVAAAARTGRVTLIDWYTLAEANLHWFFDPVHVDRDGSIARAAQIVAALAG